jgi:hypothetical protein
MKISAPDAWMGVYQHILALNFQRFFQPDLSAVVVNTNDYQWLHMIAWSLGGPQLAGLQTKSKNIPQAPAGSLQTDPQQASNLVLGTIQANGHMTVFEDFIRDYLKKNPAASLTIQTSASAAIETNNIPVW